MKIPGVLLSIALLALPAAAQDSPSAPDQAQTGDQQTIRLNVDLVDIRFTVTDKKGKFITNLEKSDFRVYEDDKPQEIATFEFSADLPLSIVLVVDTSGSIRDRLTFEQEAAIDFFYSTMNPDKDRAAVVRFDSGADLVQDFTHDPEVLANGIRRIRAGGGTALYDAVYLAVSEKLAKVDGRRILILISDGDDNSSRFSMTEALEIAQRHDVSIYTISTNTAAFFGSSRQHDGDRTLRKFAEETGGHAFFPFKLEELATNLRDITDELRSQYTIAYYPTNTAQDGSFRRIRIEVSNDDYKARARTGYYAPRGTLQQH